MSNFLIDKSRLNEILKNHKLDSNDYKNIVKIIDREPNIIELGIFSAMWSKHCSYKSSRIFLKGFPTKAPYVLQGPGENAGVIDIGENLKGDKMAVAFKMKSHNHPSFIEPHAGAATGVGGILRDIFTMGAEPIINMNLLCFGDIQKDENKKLHKHLVHGVVGGIGYYGNCVGVPTIGGETHFESCYDGNILVNAFSLGILKHDKLFYGRASGVDNPIIYVGSKTGIDGLGGAVMSSHTFESDSKKLRPTVQIGNPFTEKLLIDACLEMFKKDLIVGIQDMGSAGLTSSSFEMASKGGESTGIILHLDKVPMREEGMNPYELMLSDSQERMLICAKKGSEDEIIKLFKKYGLEAEIIGAVTHSNKVELFWHGKICASLEIKPVVDNAPILTRPIKKPQYLENIKELKINLTSINLESTIKEMLKSPDIADKNFIYNQFDSTIKNSTIKGVGLGGASVISLQNYDSFKALAMSVKALPRQCYLDSKNGAILSVALSSREVALCGAKPLAITDCLNFANVENPEIMYQFSEVCSGIKEAALNLNTPVISGNVSLYNQTGNNPIYPTPGIVSVGLMENFNKAIPSHFTSHNSELFILGGEYEEDNFAGSILQKIINSPLSGEIKELDLELEKALWECLIELIDKEILLSARNIFQGGAAIALIKSGLIGKISFEVDTKIFKNDYAIFSETTQNILCEVKSENMQSLKNVATMYNLTLTHIGFTKSILKDKNLKIGEISIDFNEARDIYYDSFSTLVDS